MYELATKRGINVKIIIDILCYKMHVETVVYNDSLPVFCKRIKPMSCMPDKIYTITLLKWFLCLR